MAGFNYPGGTIDHKGAVIPLVGSDGTITVIEFPADTSITASTLRSAPDPQQIFQGTDTAGAVVAIGSQLQSFQG